MRVAHLFSFLWLLVVSTPLHCQQPSASPHLSSLSPLQIRLTKAPFWKNNCLWLNLSRENNSKSLIFLPMSGEIIIYTSVTDKTNSLRQGSGEAWVPVYGPGDVMFDDVTRLASGKVKQDTYCLDATFPVVDSGNQTRRQVHVQGKLRIVATYFLGAPDWKISKQQRERMTKTDSSTRKNADRWNSGQIVIEFPIPCHEGAIKDECSIPPPVFAREHYYQFSVDRPAPPSLPPD